MGGGFCARRLNRLSHLLRGSVERGEIAGAVALLARQNEVHVVTEGTMRLGGGPAMERDTIFRIASMTKPIAAVAAMMLVEETTLRLDDPIEKWLPELANRKVLRSMESAPDDTVPAKRSITLRDILTMRWGIGATMAPAGTYPIQKIISDLDIGPHPMPPPFEPDELMARYHDLPLMHQPGEKWMYHNAYDILGVVIARATGMRLEDFLAQRIFDPLGMRDTAFTVPNGKADRLATCYHHDGTKLDVFPEGRGGQSSRGKMFPSGSTGLVSTVDDYLAFGRMMLDFGAHDSARLLARPTVEVMTADHITEGQKAISPFFPGFWDNHGYGFGISTITRRDGVSMVPGRFGWDGGFGTTWSSDPQEGLVTILLLQRMFDETVINLHADFYTLAYQAIDD